MSTCSVAFVGASPCIPRNESTISLFERPFPLLGHVVAGQVRQVHVAGAIHVDDQSASCDGCVSRVVDRQEDVTTMEAVVLQDGHGHVLARLGAMLVWHG
ncbi:unnamed protein product [Sphagnum balticum]